MRPAPTSKTFRPARSVEASPAKWLRAVATAALATDAAPLDSSVSRETRLEARNVVCMSRCSWLDTMSASTAAR